MGSEFGQCIPTVQIPRMAWDTARVAAMLREVSDASAPGPLGIPVAVWKALPEAWLGTLAAFFNAAEEEGRWPAGAAKAYVVLLPKVEGRCQPCDLRPITVQDLMWRVWARGTLATWRERLEREVLDAAMFGFRPGQGTRQVGQLLGDLLVVCRRRL